MNILNYSAWNMEETPEELSNSKSNGVKSNGKIGN